MRKNNSFFNTGRFLRIIMAIPVMFLMGSLAFGQELLPRQNKETGLFGYVDAENRFVIAPQFDYAMRFEGDYAVVSKGNRYGYIDRQGKLVLKTKYYKVGGYSEGYFRVQEKKGGPWTFLNVEGKRAISASYLYAGGFHDGMAVFAKHDKKGKTVYGYIDKRGVVVVKPVYDYAFDFVDGYGKVIRGITEVQPLYGYVDTKGEAVVPCVYFEEEARWHLVDYKNKK